jgi:hypothetical protein
MSMEIFQKIREMGLTIQESGIDTLKQNLGSKTL